MILSTIVAFCIVILIVGLLAGAFVTAIGGIGVLIVVGFEIGCYILPVIILYLIARAIWRMTTERNNNSNNNTTEE